MKKNSLAIIIPAYRAAHFLEKNKLKWIEISKLIGCENIYLIEDSVDREMEHIAVELGWNYFSKPNGNWGSVINFAKGIKFSQKYISIVDADDILDLDELKGLLLDIERVNDDVIWSPHQTFDYKTGKFIGYQDEFWIHTVLFRPHIFYRTKKLPESYFFTDIYFLMSLENEMKTVFKSSFKPYIYFINVDGQSVHVDEFNLLKYKSYLNLSEIWKWCEDNNYKSSNYNCPALKNKKANAASRYLKVVYSKSDKNVEKEKVINYYLNDILINGTPRMKDRIFFIKWKMKNKKIEGPSIFIYELILMKAQCIFSIKTNACLLAVVLLRL